VQVHSIISFESRKNKTNNINNQTHVTKTNQKYMRDVVTFGISTKNVNIILPETQEAINEVYKLIKTKEEAINNLFSSVVEDEKNRLQRFCSDVTLDIKTTQEIKVTELIREMSENDYATAKALPDGGLSLTLTRQEEGLQKSSNIFVVAQNGKFNIKIKEKNGRIKSQNYKGEANTDFNKTLCAILNQFFLNKKIDYI